MKVHQRSDYDLAGPSHTERLLLRVPILTSCLLGLGLGLTRFLFVLRDDLKEGALRWPGILLVIAILGSVVIVIVLACAAVGFFAGALLIGVVRMWSNGRKMKPREALRLPH